jgi:Tfp pilus assembly protein PilZ
VTLESIVVSSDWQSISVLGSVMGSLRIGISIDPETDSARARLSKAKYDAIIVDSDVEGAANFLRSLRNNPYNKKTVPLAISNKSVTAHDLSLLGARFVFEKPIEVEQAVRMLSAARNLMLRGRLRYYRQSLYSHVTLQVGQKQRVQATLTNLSQGGIGIQTSDPLEVTGPIRMVFELPGMERPLETRGEVAWSDNQGNVGIRFLEMTEKLERELEQWLAERYFTDHGRKRAGASRG